MDELDDIPTFAKRIKEKYPEFGVNEETLKIKDTPEGKLRIEAAMMVKSGMKDKGLV